MLKKGQTYFKKPAGHVFWLSQNEKSKNPKNKMIIKMSINWVKLIFIVPNFHRNSFVW